MTRIAFYILLKALLKIIYKVAFYQWAMQLPDCIVVIEAVEQCNTHCVWKQVVPGFLLVLGSVSLVVQVHLTAQGIDRDWNVVKSSGRFQDQSLKLAVDAEAGFLLLQHYSHRCLLNNKPHPHKRKSMSNKEKNNYFTVIFKSGEIMN